MHKHLLALAMGVASLALATTAFADSQTIYLSQTGSDQQADTTQVGGSNNYIGRSDHALLQENGAGTGGNAITINQSGNGNLLGWDKQAFQSGTNNTADVTQAGANSRVELQQIGTSNGRFGSVGWTNTGDPANKINQVVGTTSSVVDLYQNGSNNLFNLLQKAASSSMAVQQNGSSNQVDLQQGFERSTLNSSIVVNQNSLGGASDGNLNYNYTLLRQSGDNSQAIVNQTGSRGQVSADQFGASNYLNILQAGLNNSVGGTFGNPFNSSDDPRATQLGNNNIVNTTQLGTNGYILYNQTGNGNQLTAYQDGSNQIALLTQTGDSNIITGVQTGAGGNTATVNQTGSLSYANYSQNGSNNRATIAQK